MVNAKNKNKNSRLCLFKKNATVILKKYGWNLKVI
jgi:hypothetical protein